MAAINALAAPKARQIPHETNYNKSDAESAGVFVRDVQLILR